MLLSVCNYLDRCAGSCNTLDEVSNEVCAPNQTGDLNLLVFNMVTGINESRILTNTTMQMGM